MEEKQHVEDGNQRVSEVRDDYIDKVLAAKAEKKRKFNPRVIRLIVIVAFLLLMAVIMLPILFAVVLWISTLFV